MADTYYTSPSLFASGSAPPESPVFEPKTDHTIPLDMSLVWAIHSAGLSSAKSDRVAQMVRQVHFLERELGKKDPERNGAWLDGVHWTYQRYRDLHRYFPHWASERVVETVVKAAEKLGVLISRRWRDFKLYRVDYAGVRILCQDAGIEPPSWAFDEPEAEGVQLDIFVEDAVAQAVAEVVEPEPEPEQVAETPEVVSHRAWETIHDIQRQTNRENFQTTPPAPRQWWWWQFSSFFYESSFRRFSSDSARVQRHRANALRLGHAARSYS